MTWTRVVAVVCGKDCTRLYPEEQDLEFDRLDVGGKRRVKDDYDFGLRH